MNKKLYLILILMLTILPLVAATIGEGIDDALRFIFDATGNLAYIKAGLWLVLFFMIFKSAERIFPANRGAAVIIALVVSMLGARFIPDEYLEYLGWWFIVVIIIGIPFFLGSFFGDLARLGRGGKTFLIIIFYGIIGYSLIKWRDLGLEGPASDILDTALTWISEHRIIVLVIIVVLCLIFLWRGRGGGGGGQVITPAGTRPSFWRGLGIGAGASSRWAVNRGMALQGWMARKRATAKMRWAIREAHRRRQARRGEPPFTTA